MHKKTNPPTTGHFPTPIPSGIPYPWMQRPHGPVGPVPPIAPMNPLPPMTPMDSIPPMFPVDLPPWGYPLWGMDPQAYGMWDPDTSPDPEEARETEYWQQMYPEQTRKIQREVSRQCDLLDYEGSVMYDAYPDQISLSRICESIYLALIQNGVIPGDSSKKEQEGAKGYEPIGDVEMQQRTNGSPSTYPVPSQDRSLRDLIQVLLYQEMMRRRRHRRRKRTWYMG